MREERSLIARARSGDSEAQRRLYDLHLPAVWRLALRVTQRPELAEECVQEVFVKAFGRLGQFRAETAFAGWLYRICYRAAVDALRREGRYLRLQQTLDPTATSMQEESDPLLRRKLLAVLDQLDEIYREVFVLYHLSGASHREIAAQLAIPVGTSKRRLSVARRRLRSALQEVGS